MFFAHGTLDNRFYDNVIAPENIIIIMRAWSEVSYLGLTVEGVHEDQIQDIVCNDTLVIDFGWHESEMRTALDSKILGIKSYIFELAKLDEADKLFILFELQDKLGLLISLESIHHH